MDVSTVGIKAIAINEIALSEVMEKRLKEIRDEQKQLKGIEKACERVLKNGIDYVTVPEDMGMDSIDIVKTVIDLNK